VTRAPVAPRHRCRGACADHTGTPTRSLVPSPPCTRWWNRDESVAAAEQRLQAPILCESPSDAGSDHAVSIWPHLRRSGRTLHARGARAERRSQSEWWPAPPVLHLPGAGAERSLRSPSTSVWWSVWRARA